MRKLWKLALSLGVLTLAIVGCNQDTDGANAPDLIEPADGAVISEAPTFVWSSVPLIEDYRIVIDNGSSSEIYTPPFRLGGTDFTDPIIEKDLYDTFYTMSGADFDNLEEGTYYWNVTSLKYPSDGSAPDVNWSEVRSFAIEKPEPSGLDTTYFPFGMDYEWTYEKHCWDYYGDERTDSYYTITIRVVDSNIAPGGYTFVLEGGCFYDLDCDTIKIVDEKITAFPNDPCGTSIVSLIPDTSEARNLLSIRYRGDTLNMGYHFEMYPPDQHSYDNTDCYTFRLRGVGLIDQTYFCSWWDGMGWDPGGYGSHYSLLSFRKGGKVVWRR